MTIFVSIASYRDPQLIPTIRECLANARYPDDLRFGVCWQHGPEEDLSAFAGDPRFRILDVDWRDGKGACWARAEVMGLYDGEDHVLQLDSHHRFAEHWDARVLDQFERADSPKPVLSAYCPAYDPDQPVTPPGEPSQTLLGAFDGDGIPGFTAVTIPGFADRREPYRARFLCAHFLFAPGSFVTEVPYDPDLYFLGEEITLAVRAYTWGYDLFHPTDVIVWHEYFRRYRPKHWDDHSHPGAASGPAWYERDASSRRRIRRLLAGEPVGRYGCGPVRTIAEYEAYAGVSFQHRRVQDHTLIGLEPPNPPAEPGWHEGIRTWTGTIEVALDQLPAGALDEGSSWCLGIFDAAGRQIHRVDLERDMLGRIANRGCAWLTLPYRFDSGVGPVAWNLGAYRPDQGWLDPVSGFVRPSASAA